MVKRHELVTGLTVSLSCQSLGVADEKGSINTTLSTMLQPDYFPILRPCTLLSLFYCFLSVSLCVLDGGVWIHFRQSDSSHGALQKGSGRHWILATCAHFASYEAWEIKWSSRARDGRTKCRPWQLLSADRKKRLVGHRDGNMRKANVFDDEGTNLILLTNGFECAVITEGFLVNQVERADGRV